VKKRLLEAAMGLLARTFGVYVIWTEDRRTFEVSCRAIQDAGPPQRLHPWNDGWRQS